MKCKRKRGLKIPLYGKGTRSARRVTHIGSEIVIKNKINMQVLRLHLLLKQALSRRIYNLKKNLSKSSVPNSRSGNQSLTVQSAWKKCNEHSEIIDSVIFKH